MNKEFYKNWRNQARKGLLELAILNDINKRKMYAYEIEKKFCKSQGVVLSAGSIYNILKRFKNQKLVKTRVDNSPNGPKRKYYKLTKLGYETLVQMNGSWHAIRKALDSIEKGI